MVASVSVFLPPSLPEAVLTTALSVRESTEADWWWAIVAVSWGRVGTLTQSDSAT